nr:hypothetical protein [Tanacetum cinerariifolium]
MHPVDPSSPDYVPGPKEPEQAPLSPDYVPGPEYHEYLVPSDEEVPIEDQPYVVADSPIALSPGYIVESDLEEDLKDKSKDGPTNYSVDEGDGDVDDDDDDDDDSFDDDEEEEHLALADPVVAPTVDHVPSSKETKPFETDESMDTPPSPPAGHFLPYLHHHHHHSSYYQHPLPSSLYLPPPVPTSLPLPSPPLPASLFIPLPVDRMEDFLKAELPPPKRLCLTAPTSRYEVGESLTDARPIGCHRADYGFIGTLDAATRHRRAEEVGYSIRDVWVDPTEAVEEVALMTLEGVNARVTKLADVHEEDTQDIYVVIEDAQDRQTRLS